MKKKHISMQQILVLTLLVVFCVLLGGCGKKTQKVYRVGILCGLDFFAATADGFKAKMTELGYVEGKNVVYDLQKTNFDIATYRDILHKFVADKVDLIFVFPTEASMEAKTVTQGTGIPVVFANANIEKTSLVNSVREPGENITGVRFPGPDLALKNFEIMHEIVPQAKRMWIPYQRGYPIVVNQLEALYPVAEAAGITLIEVPADNASEIKADLDARDASGDIGMDSILFIAEPLAGTPDVSTVIVKFAHEHNLPMGGALMIPGENGTIFNVNINPVAVGRQAAYLVDKILRGTPAGTIPVVSAESYFQINYKAAQELGLKMSEGLLGRANKIIR